MVEPRDEMCFPTQQTCVEDGCERVAMTRSRVCFGHAEIDEIVG
ncbi:hypothetical protein [Halorientalis pallida]|nr:hypothetical protein [Halorientalis pallida]